MLDLNGAILHTHINSKIEVNNKLIAYNNIKLKAQTLLFFQFWDDGQNICNFYFNYLASHWIIFTFDRDIAIISLFLK